MRRSAIVVFPEGEGLARVEALRRRFDPLAQVIAAHVTLVFPFVDDLGPSQLQAHIRQAVEHRPPFEVGFGQIEAEGEYLLLSATGGRDALIELHERLYRGPLAIHHARGHLYRPHITIGRIAAEAERASALALARAELSPLVAQIPEVAVFRLESASAGSVVLAVPLPAG